MHAKKVRIEYVGYIESTVKEAFSAKSLGESRRCIFCSSVFFLVLAYANGSRIIVLVDEHFYEETFVVCVNVMSWIAPDRLKLELQTFCNVSMFTIAAEHQKAQHSQD